MNRLLFAVARGALVQCETRSTAGYQSAWIACPNVTIFQLREDHHYSIHPDDEHLQYGPISTALRKLSEYPPPLVDQLGDVARHYVYEYKYSDETYMYSNDLYRSLFLLILSEALADEGL